MNSKYLLLTVLIMGSYAKFDGILGDECANNFECQSNCCYNGICRKDKCMAKIKNIEL